MRVMRKVFAVAWVAQALVYSAAAGEYRPEWSEIKGARYNNAAAGTWDVGWSEDVHQKGKQARPRMLVRGAGGVGADVSLGHFFYPLYAATRVDLYVYDLQTSASRIELWLSAGGERISSRGALAPKGRGHYRVTLTMTRVCGGERVYLRGSCPSAVRFSGAMAYVAPEYMFPKGIEGVYIKRFHGGEKDVVRGQRYAVSSLEGMRRLGLSDYGVVGKGIPAPRLGVSVDIRVCDRAVGGYRTRLYAEDGTVAHEGWRLNVLRPRAVDAAHFLTTRTYLDSRALDTNGDGVWQPEVVREIDAVGVTAGLDYSIILPATWFEAPGGKGRYRTLRFEHLARAGRERVTLPLREDYVNRDGSVKIGFVHYSCYDKSGPGGVHKVYIVQSSRRGGIIIAMITGLRDFRCLQIARGTLTLSEKGESIQPRFGRKISYYQMAPFYDYPSNMTEFQVYGHGRVFNTVTFRAWRPWRYPPKLVWDDPYVRGKTRANVDRLQYVADTCKRYGMDLLYESHADDMADVLVHHPEYIAEYYDGKTGRLYTATKRRSKGKTLQGPWLDFTNPAAVKAIEEFWTELLGYFERLPYIELTERRLRHLPHGAPFYSRAALEGFRAYCGDPTALFPVKPTEKNTARTTNTATKEDWARYNNWKIDAYTDGAVLAMARAGRRAFKGNPHYKGLSYMDASIPLRDVRMHLDVGKIIAHPGTGLMINEHGYFNVKGQEHAAKWLTACKKHKKKIVMLANSFQDLGPGEVPPRGGAMRRCWTPEEAYWLCDKLIFKLYPELDGMCWHADRTEEMERFWRAYQTVEWDRGLMPAAEAQAIMAPIRARYREHGKDFDYDFDHEYKTVGVKALGEGHDLFGGEEARRDLAQLPANTLTAPADLFRGTPGGDRMEATFRVAAAGKGKLCFFVEATDTGYTGVGAEKYTFLPKQDAWAWKDKVDIYVGVAQHRYLWIVGGRYTEKRWQHYLLRNVAWIEARCGEEEIVCRLRNARKGTGKFAYGRAAWKYIAEAGKWQGWIEINLSALKKDLTVDKVTGFNLGIQDVDEGDANVRYLLYERYPRWVNRTARYANVALTQ